MHSAALCSRTATLHLTFDWFGAAPNLTACGKIEVRKQTSQRTWVAKVQSQNLRVPLPDGNGSGYAAKIATFSTRALGPGRRHHAMVPQPQKEQTMASIKNRMESALHGLYRQGRGVSKSQDPHHKYIHARRTLDAYLAAVGRYATWLKAHGVKSRCSDTDAAAYMQAYIDDLAAHGRSAYYIHLQVAAVCKALNLRMGDYDKPRRDTAPKMGRGDSPSLKGRKSADMDAPEHQRLVRFARAVGIRRAEYADLHGSDFVTLGNYSYVLVRHGKGGRQQLQRIDPDDVELVRSYFDGLAPGESVFTAEELHNRLNLHSLRRKHAQEMYAQYLARLESDPGYRAQLTEEVKAAFERAGVDWRRNRDMQRLASPYFLRGNVRKNFRSKSQPVKYDRLALMALSVFHLAHWRVDVTVRHYMV